jgi:hypothetical protein
MKTIIRTAWRTIIFAGCIVFCTLFSANFANAAENPQYVIDYALPVEIDLSQYIGNKHPISGEGAYGNVTVSNNSIIYTPTQILPGIDTLDIALNDSSSLHIDIVPASEVYYEEAFVFYPKDITAVRDLENMASEIFSGNLSASTLDHETQQIVGTTSIDAYGPKRQSTSKVGDKNIYGYDEKYAIESEGWSNSTQAQICDRSEAEHKSTASMIPFQGTGIEIRTGIQPDGGYVSFGLFRLNDDNSWERVRVATVNLRSSNGTTWYTSLQSDGGRGLPFIERDLPYGKYMLAIYTMGINLETCQYAPHIDGFRIFGAVEEGDDIYAKDDQANPKYYSVRKNILSQAINTHSSVEGAIEDGLENIAQDINENYENGFVLFSLSNNVTEEEMSDIVNNGPKGEFFLMPGQSIMFKVNGLASVGMNAYNKPVTYELNDDGEKVMTSNLNMYYKLSSGVNTITNTSKDAVLALTDIRTTEGISAENSIIEDMNESDIEDGLRQMMTTSVRGTVSWNAPSAILAERPDNVAVTLNSSDSENIDTVRLIEGAYAFDNLPKFNDDLDYISYSITAQDVDGFTLAVDNYDVLYSAKDSDSPTPNPSTFDFLHFSAVAYGASIIFGTYVFSRCHRRH